MQTTLFPSSDTKIVLKRQGNVKAKPLYSASPFVLAKGTKQDMIREENASCRSIREARVSRMLRERETGTGV
jgi:hypothetical protein